MAWVWRIVNQYESSKIEQVPIFGEVSTLDEISSQLPNGVYTTFRTFGHNKSLPLEPQFNRLEESAALMNKPISLNRGVIRAYLREAVRLCTESEMRIRLTLDLEDRPGTIYISMEKLILPTPEEYENGVITITQKAKRDNPKAKKTSFLFEADKIRDQAKQSVNEVLLVDDEGYIMEGLSSNFFAIRQGEIWTEDERVLSGIVRSYILEEARKAGIRIHLSAVNVSEIDSLDEAFLTSASRSVLPIQKIDGHLIGMGKPGKVTKLIMGLYMERIQRELEEI